jgi:hypothetical protein
MLLGIQIALERAKEGQGIADLERKCSLRYFLIDLAFIRCLQVEPFLGLHAAIFAEYLRLQLNSILWSAYNERCRLQSSSLCEI